jgi:hypothetical protein
VASACILGVPAERLVYGDIVERTFWTLVTARAVDLDGVRRENQATATANKTGEMLRRMFGGRRR